MFLTDAEYPRGVRILACMRSLHPDKRQLDFSDESKRLVIEYFHTNFPDTSDDVLLATVMPSAGDITWSKLADRTLTRLEPTLRVGEEPTKWR